MINLRKMASSTKRKVDLRDLMKKQRTEKKSSNRIVSPLAKYNSLGQLVCVVCNTQVKNEIVWPAHLQGKKHKENLAVLKNGSTNTAQTGHQLASTGTRQQRAGESSESTLTSRKRAGHQVTSTTAEKRPRESELPGSSTKGLSAGFFDSAISSQPSSEQPGKPKTTPTASHPENVPTDFFDASEPSPKASSELPHQRKTIPEPTKENNKERKPSTSAEAIPEGFFDDPVKDAKVRKVEVKNTMEEEWSKFQKEMLEENQVSENIQEEDQEEAQLVRNIDEIDEQIHCFAKVEALRDKQDDIRSKMDTTESHHPEEGSRQDDSRQDDKDSSSADEAEFEEFLDWRAKGVWK